MPVIIALLGLLLILPLVVNTMVDFQAGAREAKIFGTRRVERLTLLSAINRAVADVAVSGGAEQLEEDFPEVGLRVYTLVQQEMVMGQGNPILRIWSTTRPLGFDSTNNPGNLKLAATATYDPESRLVSTVRFVEQ